VKEALGKNSAAISTPGDGRDGRGEALSIALACRTFGVSETCYRYSPKLGDENEEIADLLVGLTNARKKIGDLACAFCICGMFEADCGTTSGSTASIGRWS
jgi:hypothetical protein